MKNSSLSESTIFGMSLKRIDPKTTNDLQFELARLQQRHDRLSRFSDLDRDIRSHEKSRITSVDRQSRIKVLENEIGSMTDELKNVMRHLESNRAISNKYELEQNAKDLKARIHSRKRLRDDQVEKLARLNELSVLKQEFETGLRELDLSKENLLIAIYVCETEIKEVKKRLSSLSEGTTEKPKVGRDDGAKMVFSQEFWPLFYKDLHSAQSEIIIVCKFISEGRVRSLAKVLSKAIERGVHTKVVIGPPTPENESLVDLMRRTKIEVVIREGFHQKLSVIDQNIAWHGSLNILSHWKDQGDQMCRTQEPHMVQQILKAIQKMVE